MASYVITSPSGEKYKINAPDDATPEQVMSYAQSNFGQQPKQSEPSKQEQMLSNSRKAIAGGYETAKPVMGSQTLGELSQAASTLPAAMTAYGANVISAVPGLKELGSGIAAGIGFGEGQDFGERYNSLQQAQQSMRQAGEEVAPTGTMIGKLGSNLVTAGAIPQPVPATNILGALMAGAKTGGLVGAAYGAGETDSFLPTGEAIMQRGGNLLKSGITGAAIGSPLNALGYALGAGKSTKLLPEKLPEINADKIREGASQLYQKADEIGAVIKPEFSTNVIADEVAKIKPYTSKGGLLTDDIGELAKKMTPEQIKLNEIADTFQSMKNKPMTLQEAQRIDEMFTESLDGFKDNFGKLNKAGTKLYNIQTKFRDIIDNIPEKGIASGSEEAINVWKQGKVEWAKQAKMREIEKILADGEIMDHPATSMRSGFRTLMKNPKRFNRYSPEEQSLIRKAASSGATQEFLRNAGSRLLSIAATGVGAGVGGPVGAIVGNLATTGVGMAARGLSGKIQSQLGKKVIQKIAGEQKIQPLSHPNLLTLQQPLQQPFRGK